MLKFLRIETPKWQRHCLNLDRDNESQGRPCRLFLPLSRKPADLQNLAPGTNPPFMMFDGEVKTDVNKIEEFLEEKLVPPR